MSVANTLEGKRIIKGTIDHTDATTLKGALTIFRVTKIK